MARERNPLPKKTLRSRYPKKDSWSKNDEKLYKVMGGKSKTKYSEDQATYRDFGRTYGGPTDAVPVSERKRREAGIFFSDIKPSRRGNGMRPLGPAPRRRDGEPPKKEMSPMRPLGPARRKPRGVKAQSKRMTAQAQSIAMEKVAKRKATAADRKKMSNSTTADSKRKTGQAIKMLGKKKAPSSYAIGLTKKQKGR
jgi:hypothetical protein